MSLKLDKLSILIVEDTEPLRLLILNVLEAMEVGKVLSARDAEEGFSVFCRTKPDIVVIDWHLPGMSGLELAGLIRTSQYSPDRMVPIIMMTGYSSEEKITAARDKGITEYLVKPFTAHDFVKRIFHVIQFPRDFIDCASYFGPDRRRTKNMKYRGPLRRASDEVIMVNRS